MVPAFLSAIAFLALIVWRFALTGPQRRLVVREIGALRRQDDRFLEQGRHILDRAAEVMAGSDRFEHAWDGVDSAVWKDDPKTYLLPIVAITAPTQMAIAYPLDTHQTSFQLLPG